MHDIQIGNIYKNNRNLYFKVLDEDMKKDNSGILRTYYLVEFLESGYTKWFYITNVKKGSIKDKLEKIHYSVGCVGDANIKENTKEYFIWTNMLARCYSETAINKCSYKDKGYTVCDRWLNFTNFLEDIKNIDGYNRELIYAGKLELDKDLKQKDVEYKVYSPDTTCFISKKENLKLRNINQHDDLKKSITAISPEGKEIEVFGLRDFCRKNNLNRGVFNKVINKKQESHKGWKVKHKEEKEDEE